jgi:hypothetical protein
MLAVHWTPVNNTKTILRNGITQSKRGVYCFPLTGHKSLDRWWIYFFNQCGARARKQYNGIVFRIQQADLPAYFGDWAGATNRDDFESEITDLKQLGQQFRQTILWRLGEDIARKKGLDQGIKDWQETETLYLGLAQLALLQNPKAFMEEYNSLDYKQYAFEDYQIVLSHSIPAKRIIKILPQGNEFGRVLRKQKRDNFSK